MTLERNDEAEMSTDLDETGSLSDDEATEVAEIRADIEETRQEMGGTLSQLGDRLDPGHLVNQAKENVREATIGRVEETAKGVSDMVVDTIKRNPIPAAMAGAGLALLWANRSQGNGHGPGGYEARGTYEARGGYGSSMRGYGDSQIDGRGYDRSGGQGVGDRVGGAAAAVGVSVGGAVGSVADTAQQVGGEAVNRAGQAVGEVGWRLDRFMQASPLAMGAIAVGAGAVAGALLPETEPEREFLGDASRQVAGTIGEAVDQAASTVEEQMDRTEEKVGSQT